jgi:hypothetical protein
MTNIRENPIFNRDSTVLVSLGRENWVLVDDSDYKKFCVDQIWHASSGYASRFTYPEGKPTRTYLHRLIMKPPAGMITDHINGDRADCRRCNLRVVSYSQNSRNRTQSKRNSSGVVGVSFDVKNQIWAVRICVNSRAINLGNRKTFHEAVAARREGERAYYGSECAYESRNTYRAYVDTILATKCSAEMAAMFRETIMDDEPMRMAA